MELKTILILIIIAGVEIISSCKSYSLSNEELIKNEINYYNLKEQDTILDIGIGQAIVMPRTAIAVNNLYIYLGHATNVRYVNYKSVEYFFDKFNKESKSNNSATFIPVQQNGESIHLNNNSVNKVLCRRHLYSFDHLDKIASEFHRVLKPKGQLIVVQQLVEKNELSNRELKLMKNNLTPNESNLTSLFERNGFRLMKAQKVIYNPKMEKVTGGNLTMFFFEKVSS